VHPLRRLLRGARHRRARQAARRRCPHLGPDDLCTIYESRPDICRRYQADDFCARIAAPTLDERVRNYLRAFELEDEAAALARRPLPVIQ
jgi:Fe-S-cluster containining protein